MRVVIVSLAALLCAAACSKSVEGEGKRWQRNLNSVKELSVLYPGFKGALEAQRATAEAAMKEAEAISGEEQRIEKMAAANQLLDGGFVGQLADVDRTTKKIRELIVTVSGKTKDEADRLSARQAAESAERVLSEVQTTLARGAPDPAAAAVVLKKVSADLRAATSNLDKVARAVRDKERKDEEANAKAGQGGDKAAAGATDPKGAGGTAPAAATWTCEYCDHQNAAEATTCSNCGAARPKAKSTP
ncbi:zinc finger Ran-binding domain-containing protein [Haliangium sp.]|uniref:zinc finger Ran-binding domain-containing protein n=1 Tax=Haliangium sp. TaxID=2663208 RepID=UPI003D0D8071